MSNDALGALAGLDVLRRLAEAPYEADLFQALRRLECIHADRPRLGRSVRLQDDPVRLGQEVSCAFAPASVATFEPGVEGRPHRLRAYGFGLTGPNGPLPLHITEFVRDRVRQAHDPTLRDFLDVLHHRLIALFYRSWADSEPVVHYDRPDEDRFRLYLGSVIGLGLPALDNRTGVTDRAKLHFAGHLAAATCHPERIIGVLSEYFGLPVVLEEFVGHYLELPPEGQLRLGESPGTGQLGLNTCVGARVWDRQARVRLVFGPLGLADYERLLPAGDSFGRLAEWMSHLTSNLWSWDLNLVLRRDEAPPTSLGGSTRLGWTSWLGEVAGAGTEPLDDLILTPGTAS